MIKLSKKNKKLIIDKFTWTLIGLKSGWIPSHLKTSKRNNRLIKSAGVEDVDRSKLEEKIRENLKVVYKQSFVLKNDNFVILEEPEAFEKIANAFLNICDKNERFCNQIKTYINADRKFNLGVYFSTDRAKKYLVPTFNGMGITELKYDFINNLDAKVSLPPRQREYVRGEDQLKSANSLGEIAEMIGSAGFLTANGEIEIGSIGSRSTNWDTSYNLRVDGMSAGKLHKVLTWFTDIENQDISNLTKTDISKQFDLTLFKEVSNVVSRLGIGNEFIKKVEKVKEFEDQQGLKERHKRDKRIKDYKQKTIIETMKLSDYGEQIFASILDKMQNYPRFVQIFQNNNVRNVEDFVDTVFSMGKQGVIVDGNNVEEVVKSL